MKSLNYFSLLFLSVYFSCSSEGIKNEQKLNADFKTFDTLIPFKGYWVSENYFNSIKKHQSPKTAQDNSEFIFIPEKTLQPMRMIYDFHDGGPNITIVKKGELYQIYTIENDTLLQLLDGIEIVSENKIKIGENFFVKVNVCETKDNYKILEEILFKGQYIDAKGNEVEFLNDGRLLGLNNLNYYVPIRDYYDEGMQVDQVALGQSESDFEWFGFKFKNDTLELYTLKCLAFDSASNACGEVDYGLLKYKLWKKK